MAAAEAARAQVAAQPDSLESGAAPASRIPGRTWRPGRGVLEALAEPCGVNRATALTATECAVEIQALEQRAVYDAWQLRAASPAVRVERVEAERRKLEARAAGVGPIRFEVPITPGSRNAVAAFERSNAVMTKRLGIRLPEFEVRGARVALAAVGPTEIAPRLERAMSFFSKTLQNVERIGIN